MLRILLTLVGRAGLVKYVCLGIFSGLCSFLFINLLTHLLDLIMNGKYTAVSHQYFVIFSSVVLLFIWSRKALSTVLIKYTQVLLWNLRKEVISNVLKANYEQFQGQKSKILTTITNNVYAITEASMQIISFTTEIVLAFSCLVFMAVISPALCLITIGFAIAGILIYQLGSKKINRNFENSLNLEVQFQGKINDILNGFKEIHMEPKKGEYIYQNRINTIAGEAIRSNVGAYTRFINSQITGQILFYILTTLIVLWFSVLLNIQNTSIINFIFTLLYFIASIQSLMAIVPNITKATVASRKIIELKNELNEAGYDNVISKNAIKKDDFREITVSSISYKYGDTANSFGIDEVDFQIMKGDVIFIYGGNGSGKTTFIYCLLGLYHPHTGKIELNNEGIDKSNYAFYRTAFSVVFNDFYLFEELHIIPDQHKWESYISLFELEGKVELIGNRLSTTDLSTGQKKRLALIISLLEEKPILVLDEWAADQDPSFRKKFYTQIIPLLKQQGFTILAITHDDRYYECADKLYKMNEGKLTIDTRNVLFGSHT